MESNESGFRPEILEKVTLLLSLLQNFKKHPFLKNRFALKGGTALNLFFFSIPRLSIDIDINYIGSVDHELLIEERQRMEEAIRAVCARENFFVQHVPAGYAGGKWLFNYHSAMGQGGNLQVDVNFMFRLPFWQPTLMNSHPIGTYQADDIPVMDIHEIAAGKLTALLARRASRDLFDAHILLTQRKMDIERLRLAFVLYGAMNRKDWREIKVEDIRFEKKDLDSQILPLLRTNFLTKIGSLETYGMRLVEECRRAFADLLPLKENEQEFLNRLLDQGEIMPSLITQDDDLAETIRRHPLIQWKTLNVKKHKK